MQLEVTHFRSNCKPHIRCWQRWFSKRAKFPLTASQLSRRVLQYFLHSNRKTLFYNENRDLIWQKQLCSHSSVKAQFQLNAKTMKCLSAVTKHVLLLRSWTSFYLLLGKSLPTGTEGFGFCLFCNELCVCTYKTALLLNTGAAALALFTLSQNLILSSQFDLFQMNAYLKVSILENALSNTSWKLWRPAVQYNIGHCQALINSDDSQPTLWCQKVIQYNCVIK